MELQRPDLTNSAAPPVHPASLSAISHVRWLAGIVFTLIAALLLMEWRLGIRFDARSVGLPAIALSWLAILGAAGALALATSTRSVPSESRLWMFVAVALFVWDIGQPAPEGASRYALLVFNGGYAIGIGAFLCGLSWAFHTGSSVWARRRLVLDLMPQTIGLAVLAWLGWIGPQALDVWAGHWIHAVDAGHGIGDMALIALCMAGIVGRRQGMLTGSRIPLLCGIALLALGDVAVLPEWARYGDELIPISSVTIGAGLLLIGCAMLAAWRSGTAVVQEPAARKLPSALGGQLPNITLIGLLALAAVQAVAGERMAGGVATAAGASIVVIVFGMIRQAVTVRRERRLQQEINLLSEQIDGLVSQIGRDPLTGLLNHRAVHERLEQEIEHARLHRSAIAVALVDVDNFKSVNDQRGHQAGDRVLRAIASILVAACRGTDVAARYAGDEFMLIFSGLDEADAAQVCQRIVDEVRRVNPELALGDDVGVTLSVGVAVSHRRGRGVELVAIADAAMYDAKEDGKDRVVVVDADALIAAGSGRLVSIDPSGGLPLLQGIPRCRDRRRTQQMNQAS